LSPSNGKTKMRALSTTDLLRVWELGERRGNVERGLAMLRIAYPELGPDAPLDMTIGNRDARLLDIRQATFGNEVSSIAACPSCGECVEFEFSIDDVRVAIADEMPTEAGRESSTHCVGFAVRFRPATSRDLFASRTAGGLASARRSIVRHCVLEARRGGAPCSVDELPAEVVDAIADGMRRADPQADARVDLTCPACAHDWADRFDVVSFVWSEFRELASRLFREVHVLARHYGWNEDAILQLSTARRRAYLELAQS
jgi:hypothetical protein